MNACSRFSQRTSSFFHKSSGCLFKRKNFLLPAAETAHGHRAGGLFLGADDKDHRHLCVAVFADFLIDLFVPDIQFGAKPGVS